MGTPSRTKRRTVGKILLFVLLWALLGAGLWGRAGEFQPWIPPLAFVLALLVFSSNLRELRRERVRRASLEAGEYELSRYVVFGAGEGRARWFRSGRLLRTTDRSVEMWQDGKQQWRRPWRDLTFAGVQEAGGERLTVQADGVPPETLRLTAGATVYEVLRAARGKGAHVQE